MGVTYCNIATAEVVAGNNECNIYHTLSDKFKWDDERYHRLLNQAAWMVKIQKKRCWRNHSRCGGRK